MSQSSALRDFAFRVFKIQPGEGWKVLQFAILGAVMQSGVAVGMSTADALFLSHLGVDKLPYIYLLTPAVMALYVPTYTYLLGKYGIDRVFDFTLSLVILGGIGFYFAVANVQPGTSEAMTVFFLAKLYSGLWYIGLYSLYWNFTDSFFDIQDGKRLFAFFSGGGSAGAVLGGIIVAAVTRFATVDKLFLAWAILGVATFPVMIAIRRRHAKLEEPEDESTGVMQQMVDTAHAFRTSTFVMIFSALLLTTLVLTTVNEYQYMDIFSQNNDERALARLFGTLYAAVNVFNFVVNFFLFNRMVLSFGVRNVALIQPFAYAAGFTFLLLNGGLPAAIFAFFVYHGVLTSIDYNNQNLLFNAVPPAVKKQVRTIIEGMAEPLAIAVGGAFLLLFAKALGPEQISLVGLAAALAAVALAFVLRTEYLESMIVNLKRGWLDLSVPSDGIYRNLDAAALPGLRERALAGPRAATHAAIRILWANDRELATRTLLEYLEAAPPEEIDAAQPLLAMMLREKDGEVVRLLLYWLIHQEQRLSPAFLEELGYHSLLQPRDVANMFQSEQPDELAVAAVTSWNSWKPVDRLEALRTLESLMQGDVDAVRAGVRAIGRLGEERLAYYLVPHLRHPSNEVRHEAIQAIHRVATRDSSRLIPDLLHAMESADEQDRITILDTLACIGDPNCIPPLLRAAVVFSPYEQRHVGSVLLAIGLKSVPTTVSVLNDPANPYPSRVIAARGLGRLALPQLEALSGPLIQIEIRRAYRFAHFHDVLSGHESLSAGVAVLSRFYRDMQGTIIDFILEILTMTGRLPDFELISSSLRSRSAKERGNAIETIEQGVSRPVFRLLLPLLDPRLRTDRVALSARYAEHDWTVDEVVDHAFVSPFPIVCAAAAQALWDLKPQDAPRVLREHFTSNLAPLFRDTVLALFARGGPEERLNTIEKLACFARAELFGLLSTVDLERIATYATEARFEPNATIYSPGDAARDLFVVRTGSVKVNGTRPVETRGEARVIGEECLFGISARRDAAVSEGADLLVLSGRNLLRAAGASSRVGVELLGWKLERGYALEE